MVKFRLNWASEPSCGMVERPRMLEATSSEGTGDKENDTPMQGIFSVILIMSLSNKAISIQMARRLH